MAEATRQRAPGSQGSALSGLKKLGVASWSLLGVILLAILIAGGLSALSNIVVPLIIAVILGTVLEPLVTWLVKKRMPRALAATLVLSLATIAAAGMTWVLVIGFVHQVPEISAQILHGWNQVMQLLHDLDLDPSWMDQLRYTGMQYLEGAGRGAMGLVTSAVFGTVSLSIGVFFALYFLFFVLRDGKLFPQWLARITKQDTELLEEIDGEVQQSLRGYFSGTAITAVITGPIFVIPLMVLGIPLVIPMIILYFVLSFIPFVGAWLTGAFALLIAFGFGGPSAALIVGAGLLISNGPIQNIVSAWALGTSLKLHPVMVLIATMAGGVVAGVLGMVLGPPVMSALQKTIATVQAYRARQVVLATHEVMPESTSGSEHGSD